ncbi:epsilon subunit of F1F0-ATP synthase N-terminal domain-containing protein [Cystobasidium minutum MCA 4210]|uniref:epsilon subunit of F1F0-ATP synthase N-terminal domain-containing protein n=1 Tax=Cystobasidium minutum MCA 4210 TaxID=1397322 RepID=UPI0034CEFB99|eukprot:jgi/Rhomi1/168058/fgenesh1_kg.2_\
MIGNTVARGALPMLSKRAAAGARPAAAILRRGYAEAVDSSKIKLSLVLPHESIFSSQEVTQVNIAAASGDMGILANHVPAIEPLKPGVIEVIESAGQSKKWFASGGFANIHPSNSITINAVEAFPLEDFSPEAVRAGLQEAERVVNGSGSEAEKAEARVEVEVFEALQAALKQ